MRRLQSGLTVGPRAVTTAGVVLLTVGGLLVAVALVASTAASARGPASGPSITVTPHDHLKAAEHLIVRGKDLVRLANGALLECNTTPGEPAMLVSIHGVSHAIPVGCTAPVTAATNDLGRFVNYKLEARTGPLGTWESGTDSSGGQAATDSTGYPCPPTPAQLEVGATCAIEFLDNKDQLAIRTITFKGQAVPPPTTVAPTTTAP